MDPQNPQHGQQRQQMPAYDLSHGGHYGASSAVRVLGLPQEKGRADLTPGL